MTQAFNLALFANKLNTSGQTDNTGLQNSSITVNTTSPITGGATTALGSSLTIAHANSGVTAATYTAATITVNAQGHITSASNGAAAVGIRSQVFTSSGTFTIPTGITSLKVTVIGGGGGGGGGTSDGAGSGGIGGSGGTSGGAIRYLTGLTSGLTLAVTVGAGGTAGGGGGTGGAGGTSSIASGTQTITTTSCPGGTAGIGGTSDTNGASGTNSTGTGGTFNTTGLGNITAYGLGQRAASPENPNNGLPGLAFGGGGSGGVCRTFTAGQTRTGGAGAAGVVIIEF
jgi:hypothetical protein